MMQRSTEQYPSLQFYKSNLGESPGKVSLSCPCFGQEETLSDQRCLISRILCSQNRNYSKDKGQKTEKWEVAKNGWKGESGLLSPAQFWSHCFQNLLEDKLSRLTGCCTVFPEEHTAVCMVHIFLPDDSTAEKDQEINRLSDHKSMLL